MAQAHAFDTTRDTPRTGSAYECAFSPYAVLETRGQGDISLIIAKTQQLCIVGPFSFDIRWDGPNPDSSCPRFLQTSISYLSRCLELGMSRSLWTIRLPVLRVLSVVVLEVRWICHRSLGRTSIRGCPWALLHPEFSYALTSNTSNCIVARPYSPCNTVF